MVKLRPSKDKKEGNPTDQELLFEPITAKPVPIGISVVNRYPLKEPFVHVIITEDPIRKTLIYLIDELKMNEEEKKVYSDIINILQIELKVPRSEVDPKKYFEEHAKRTVEKYKLSLGKMPNISWSKILYFAERDMIGYGPIDPIMLDPNIEDVSVDGVGKPVFVWHRNYESLETNLTFKDDQELDDTIIRLVHLAGKHISTAYPVVDATLPGRHRLAATFRREVSPQGSTISIRKFREDPITIIDMLNFGTLDYKIASYLWMLMENRSSTIVVGATASGKTTMLNSLLTMVRPNLKIVTIEEVQEINIPHQNWIPLVSRPSYGLSSDRIGEVSLYDLVKASLRMRPDVLVVGEVRGEEAFVLFQAISTGHGGNCTLHADDVYSAMQRLTSKPMDVSPSYIPFIDLVVSTRRVAVPIAESGHLKIARRVISVDEVVEYNKYLRVFEWAPSSDSFVAHRLEDSYKLKKLARDRATSVDEVLKELERRVLILDWLRKRGIRNYRDIGAIFEQYHNNPSEIYEKIEKQVGPIVK
ncbi:MAG: type II/IV secretion system ATPase subunit [archaeon]|nr:type II/IV secretion system ATPase subunit [archaeon]MCP8314628.1 type II/IV secretion system ATPase subunit [archaeon]MCP8316027.1 type II/IV secretion system ATPase subunit [archaeon]